MNRRMWVTNTIKAVGVLISGFIGNAVDELAPLVVLTFLFVLGDNVSAFRLARRVAKHNTEIGGKKASGKFSSYKFGKSVFEMTLLVPTALLMAYLTQKHLLIDWNIHAPRIVAGIIIFWQLWSILENESSHNDVLWAKVLQRVMVDKTERHFDINLEELKKDTNGGNRQTNNTT